MIITKENYAELIKKLINIIESQQVAEKFKGRRIDIDTSIKIGYGKGAKFVVEIWVWDDGKDMGWYQSSDYCLLEDYLRFGKKGA